LRSAGGINYAYDGDGHRVSKVGSKLYWYGSGGDILAETDTCGNTTAEYIFFGGKRIAMIPWSGQSCSPTVAGNPIYYVEDLLGTSRVITTNSGVVCYDADFYPFGGERPPYTNNCPATNNYKFEGKERDTETGNDDFGARYYSNRFGRWLSADWSSVPVAVPYANLTNPQTLNLYSMVADDPESFADLDGHDSVTPSGTPTTSNLSCEQGGVSHCSSGDRIAAAEEKQSGTQSPQPHQKQQSAAQALADMAKSGGDKHDMKLAAKLALLDAADKQSQAVVNTAKGAISPEVEVKASAGPLSISNGGDPSLEGPATTKPEASVSLTWGGPAKENTVGDIHVNLGVAQVGTKVTTDGKLQGFSLGFGPKAEGPVGGSIAGAVLEKAVKIIDTIVP
jgi:RHS repeat-associated protein